MSVWWLVIALLLATMLNYMDRQALAVSLAVLKRDHGLTEDRIGTLEMAFGLAFAAGSLLFGWLADRVGPKRLYPLVLAGWSVVGAATALAAGKPPDELYDWLLGCRTLLGLLEAGHWPCALLTLKAVLDDRRRTLGNGLLQAGASLGAILVPVYAAAVEAAGYGWPTTFAGIGAVGLLWLPLWLILTRGVELKASGPRQRAGEVSPPASGPRQRAGEVSPQEETSAGVRVPPARLRGPLASWSLASWSRTSSSLASRSLALQLLSLAVVVGCLNVSWQFLRAWLPLYLEDNQKLSTDASRAAVVGYFVASDVGCVLAGLLVRRLVDGGRTPSSARTVGFALFAGLTLAAAAVPWVPGAGAKVALLMVAGAGILGLHPLYYAAVQELPAGRVGVFGGGLAAVGWVVAAGFQRWVGEEIKRTQSYADGLTVAGMLPLVALAAVLAAGRFGPPLPALRGRGWG